jgi:hypothetical protein
MDLGEFQLQLLEAGTLVSNHRVNRMAPHMEGVVKKRAVKDDEAAQLPDVVAEETQNTKPILYVALCWRSSRRRRIVIGQYMI